MPDGQRGERTPCAPSAVGRRKQQRGDAAEHGRQQHDARRAEAIEQRQQQQAAHRGADQIGAVDDVDPRRLSRVIASEMTAPPVKNGSAASA